jgi:hypothetical protein
MPVPVNDMTFIERIINSFLDHAPTIITFLVGGIGFVVSLRNKLTDLGAQQTYTVARVENVEAELKKQTDILSEQAAMQERLNAHDNRMNQVGQAMADLRQDIRDLRFGRGFVLEGQPPHSSQAKA